MSSKKIRIGISEEALEGIASLLNNFDLATKINGVIEESKGLQDIASLMDYVLSELDGENREMTLYLMQSLMGLHSLRQRLSVSAPEFLDIMTLSIDGHPDSEWRDINFEKWKDKRNELEALFSPDSLIAMLRKSSELTYLYQNVLSDLKILTDIRPIFDDSGKSVLKAIINHSMVIEYFDGSTKKQIHFAMDTDDIIRLQESCEQAQIKALTIRETFGNMLSIVGGAHDEKKLIFLKYKKRKVSSSTIPLSLKKIKGQRVWSG
ncbi:MAG: hypothetical protein AAGG51_22215 [Cyanobacteria bacterium P01_G01_bin.54]